MLLFQSNVCHSPQIHSPDSPLPVMASFEYVRECSLSARRSQMGPERIGTLASSPTLNPSEAGVLHVRRPVFNQNTFQEIYDESRLEQNLLEAVPLLPSSFHQQTGTSRNKKCSNCCSTFILTMFPVLRLLWTYDVRKSLPLDALSGITTAFIRIPQSMAYATLAQLQPAFGLYTSLWSGLLYILVGGSQHLMTGPQGIVSLMVGASLRNVLLNGVNTNNISASLLMNISSDLNPYQDPISHVIVDIVVTITFVTGLIQAAMGLLRLGFITNYLSDPLIGGFTTAAACSILVSQMPALLGLRIPTYSGTFNTVYSIIDLIGCLHLTNPITLLLSLLAILILVLLKEINSSYQHVLKVPIPGELLVLSGGILVSYFAEMNKKYQVKIVGPLPSGFLPPHPPNMEYVLRVLPSALPLAIISFAIAYALAKKLALKHGYNISGNGELYALGTVNVVSSFFSCFPTSASMSSTSLHDNLGGQSQFCNLFSCLLILLTLLFLGDMFAPAPTNVLAVIVLVNMRSIFAQFLELRVLWKVNKMDFLLWLVTWIGVMLLDIDVGLALGVVFSLMSIVFRTQWPLACTLGRIPQTDIYKNRRVTPNTEEVPGCVIFRFEGPLYFASAEHFRQRLYAESGCNPLVVHNKKQLPFRHSNDGILVNDPPLLLHHIILDFSVCSFLDSVGLRMLHQMIDEYEAVEVRLLLANVRAAVRAVLLACDDPRRMISQRMYLSTHDAVLAALAEAQQTEVRDLLVADVASSSGRSTRQHSLVANDLLFH